MATDLKRKLEALLAIAQRGGTENEQRIARTKLQLLLNKHGVSLDSLNSITDTAEPYRFSYRTKHERQLLHQIVYMVTERNVETYIDKRGRRVDYVIAKAETIQVEYMFNFWRRRLADELERCTEAFIQVNDIFGPPIDRPHKKSLEEQEGILDMAQTMSPSRPLKQIE